VSDIEDFRPHVTYVVRVSRDDRGGIRGVVVQVATGQRLPFSGAAGGGPLLQELIAGDLDTAAPEARSGDPDASPRSDKEAT
jgi:hypothetical protein